MSRRKRELSPDQIRGLVATLEQQGLLPSESVERLAGALGVEVVSDELPAAVAGYAMPIEDQWYIVVSPGLPPEERERTLVHELAHAAFGIRDNRLADAVAAEVLFARREGEFWAAVRTVGELGNWYAALSRVSTALLNLLVLEPHLIDDRKKRRVHELSVALAFVAITGLAGFGIVKLFEFFARLRRRSQRYKGGGKNLGETEPPKP